MDGRGRRVAVTGLGVVAPCGIGAAAFWDGLLGPGITSGRSVRLADWDPSPWYDSPKEARRADRVEQFATAAAAEAMAGRRRRRCRPGPLRHDLRHRDRRSRDPRGTGRGAHREGRAACLAVPRPDDDGQRQRGGDLDALRPARPQRDDLHGVRRRHPRHRQRRPADRLGPLRRGRHRWCRGGGDGDVAGRVRQHDGAVDLGRVPPVRRRPRRVRDGRGRRRPRARGVGSRHRPRRHDPRRDRRGGEQCRRPPHHRAVARRRGGDRVHEAGPRGRRPGAGRHPPDQRPRHVDAAQRRRRGGGRAQGVRRVQARR